MAGREGLLRLKLYENGSAGSHTIFIAEVEEVVVRDGDPLLYYRASYRRIEGSAETSQDSQEHVVTVSARSKP